MKYLAIILGHPASLLVLSVILIISAIKFDTEGLSY